MGVALSSFLLICLLLASICISLVGLDYLFFFSLLQFLLAAYNPLSSITQLPGFFNILWLTQTKAAKLQTKGLLQCFSIWVKYQACVQDLFPEYSCCYRNHNGSHINSSKLEQIYHNIISSHSYGHRL